MTILWDYQCLNQDGNYVLKTPWENLIRSVIARESEIVDLYMQGVSRPLDVLIERELEKFNAKYKKDGSTTVWFDTESSLTHFLLVWS